MTTQVNTFSLGSFPTSKQAPTLPEPLDQSQFHTRQDIRDYNNACEAFYEHQRDVAYQIKVDADNQRSFDLAESRREQTDLEYDQIKREQWQTQKDKEAARLAKEKSDAMERTAYLLSTPPVAELFHRSEFAFLKDFEFWVSKGYSLGDDGLQNFQPGYYSVQLTAPVAKKVGK